MFFSPFVPLVAIHLILAACPTVPSGPPASCYEPASNTVYLRTHNADSYFHELGHAYDFQAMTDTDRSHLARYFPPGEWRGGVEENFASAFADCALRVPERSRPVCRWLLRRTPASLRNPWHGR